MFDPVTMLAAFAPVIVDAGRALVGRYLTPENVRPSTIAEVIELRRLDIEHFRIMQDADKGGDTYKWVEAIRKLQRPAVVVCLLGAFVYNPDNMAVAMAFQAVGWYLFGERTYIAGKGKK